MRLAFRRICLAAAAAAALLAAAPGQAQTVTTYGVQLPSEVLGLRYAGAWPVSGPHKEKALVVGYNGGDKGEASVMLYENPALSQSPEEQKLAEERGALIERMGRKTNTLINPKIVSEGSIRLPEFPQPLAIAHMTTEYGDDKQEVHYFLSPIGTHIVGISYATKAGSNSLEDAKAFVSQFGSAFRKNMEAVR